MKRPSRPDRRGKAQRFTAYALGGAVFAISGAALAALVLVPSTPTVLVAPDRNTEVPLVTHEFADAVSVDIAIEREPDTTITSPVGGRVTKSGCRDGARVASGDTFLSVDGGPLLSLATSAPLWRDLTREDRGEDVRALQSELARLGTGVAVDGEIGRSTLAAVDELHRAIDGDPGRDSTVESARILWIPEADATVKRCSLATGSLVSPGDEIATVAGHIGGAHVVQLPASELSGERVLRLGTYDIEVSDEGELLDLANVEAAIHQLAADSSGRDDDASRTVAAQLALREPQAVSVVPPSAVYDVRGASGCVESRGRSFEVRIVGSQLGQTYLVFEELNAPQTVAQRPKVKSQCR